LCRRISGLSFVFHALLLSLTCLAAEEGTPPDLDIPLLPPSGWQITSAREWAKTLQLPIESETKYQSSYRDYCSSRAQILGADPKSISLVATEDHPEQLTILFANKGDSASSYLRENNSAKPSLRDIADIKRLIEADHDTLQKKMITLFGKPSRQGLGDSGKAREFPQRWDYQGTAFLLTERPGEYCTLRILPSTCADQGGKTARISDSALLERMKNNVVHRPNGDLIIENIPMIDQGPKGFCVPATYARTLLYAGVPADLYLLALLGRTEAGGGTSTPFMRTSARDLAASYGRSITTVSSFLEITKLESFFERGIPLTWDLFVDDKLNQDLSTRLLSRIGTDPETWSKSLEPKRKSAGNIRKNKKNGHVCLLIGCNRKTGELATSDSWGPEFSERWITIEEARAISQGEVLGAVIP